MLLMSKSENPSFDNVNVIPIEEKSIPTLAKAALIDWGEPWAEQPPRTTTNDVVFCT
jgi:hypothetical protein